MSSAAVEVTEMAGAVVEVLDETSGTTVEVQAPAMGIPGRPGVIVIDADQDLPPDGTPAGVVVYQYTS